MSQQFGYAGFSVREVNVATNEPGGGPVPMVAMARSKFPGSPASLDALCRRFNIDNSMREKHGALLDSEILAEVYLELIGGRQPDFGLSNGPDKKKTAAQIDAAWRPTPRPNPLPSRLTEEERSAHEAMIAKMGEAAIWSKFS